MNISIQNICKSFGDKQVLNDLSLEIKNQDSIALIGKNGAGKSTLVKLIAGLMKADSGTISYGGVSPEVFFKSAHQNIGIVPQDMALYEQLSVMENLKFWGRLYKMPKRELVAGVKYYLQHLGLESIQHKRVNVLSIGQRKIVSLLCAIIHQPKLLFLDEPTVGIDLFNKEQIFDFIDELKNNGITLIFTTHTFSEIPRICEKIAILKDGQIADFGTEQSLYAKYELDTQIQIAISKGQMTDYFIGQLNGKGIKAYKTANNEIIVANKNSATFPELIGLLHAQDNEISNIQFTPPSLENIFIESHK